MDNEIKKTIKLLNDYMQKYGYNQKHVAEKLGVNESTVSRWLKGQGVTWKHINAIQFLTEGHLETFKCKITGREKCPFDPDDHLKIAVIKKIMELDDEQLALLIGRIEHIKKQTGELSSDIKTA